MRKLLTVLAVALAIPTMSYAGGEGRYQALLLEPNKNQGVFLILDTKTGKMKLCDSTQSWIGTIRCGEEQNGN